jgi:glycosyltransferase involved in cell wall biosynthesis
MMRCAVIISIITPCLNRAGFVAEAVESVLQQEYPLVEHIVMDGGSTDGTLELLDLYPQLKVTSQPDAGLYDAINKGLHLAQGEVIGFLNTDDLYESRIFDVVAQTFINHPEIDALVGGSSIFHEKDDGTRVTLAEFSCVPQHELLSRATEGAPIFNAWFFRRRLCHELAGFDLRYRYVADRDFLIRMALQGRAYASLDKPVYKYRMHPGSFTLSGSDSGEHPFMFESRTLAERYICSNVNPGAVKHFRKWHSQIVNEQIWTAYRRKGFGSILRYMLIGLRYNAGWPRLFMIKFLERLSLFLPLLRRTSQDSSLPVD